MARARQIELAFAAAVLALAPACDIVQGFKDAGDALFPPVKTYLDVPGFRLVAGSYTNLDMLTTSEPFVFARSSAPDDNALYVMRFQDPKPCRIPEVTAYWSAAGEHAERTYIAYFDATGSSIVHFSDTACRPYELTLEDAGLPIGFTPVGLVVPAGSDLYVVNPSEGTADRLASNVEDIDTDHHLVRADGKLGSFDRDWKLVSWVGDGVKRSYAAFGAMYFEDAAGVHRLSISNVGAASVRVTTIASDACDSAPLPATPHLSLIAFHSPCGAEQLSVWDTTAERTTPLTIPAAPNAFKLYAARGANGTVPDHPNLTSDPYWALYLTNVDPSSNTGSLVARTPAGDDLALGDGAALERAELDVRPTDGDYTGGFALLDSSAGTGRFVGWDANGTVTDIVTDVIRSPANPLWNRLVVAVDESRADLVEVVDGRPVVVSHDVWRPRYAYALPHPVPEFKGKMAWLEDVEGTEGTLSLAGPDPTTGSTDDQRQEPLYTSTPVASGVHVNRNGFMSDLPGLVFLTHYDRATNTGQLEYSNAELEFSAVISEGVADYVQPGSGILYSVPYGAGAGLWLVRAK